ncbi:MAG: KamA family radical SAM protein [Geobacteraceae bacterium]|nr:KamA family radical SAM protein [Geobacteraceae bacterium]
MEKWQKNLKASLIDADELASYFHCDGESLSRVVDKYPMRISPHYLSLIQSPGDPIWRQCVPDIRELQEDGLLSDPLEEENLSPTPCIIHRYPDRVVFLATTSCAVYCRFCMRKRKVGCSSFEVQTEILEAAIRYIEETSAVRDVILSGGDPLLLSDDHLEYLLQRLRKISHVEIVRIGTRVPVTLPERITPKLCRMLKSYHPLFINTHFNHPLEVTSASSEACARLADAGIPLGNQTVLLKGVNDDLETMKRLMQKLLTIRVRPYYIHQMDMVKGTGHFRAEVKRGIEIMKGLRGHTSGLANPYYVIDAPGGKGKVPLLPDSVCFKEDTLLLRGYQGDTVEYPL